LDFPKCEVFNFKNEKEHVILYWLEYYHSAQISDKPLEKLSPEERGKTLILSRLAQSKSIILLRRDKRGHLKIVRVFGDVNARKFSFIFDASDDDVDLTSLNIIVYKFVRDGEENFHLHFKSDERDTFIHDNNIR